MVTDLVTKGVLEEALERFGNRYTIDWDKGMLLLTAHQQQGKKKNNIDFAKDINESKSKKLRMEAAQAELNYRARLGELVEVTQVEKEAFELARMTRDKLLQIPDRLAPLIAAERNETKCFKMLQEEIIEALKNLSADDE